MANVEDKVAQNIEGSYYVDEQCIACSVCVGEAPENFEMAMNMRMFINSLKMMMRKKLVKMH